MNLGRLHDISLKWKLLIPFLLLAFMGATALFLVSYHFQADLIHLNEQERLRDKYQFFLNEIDFKTTMAMSLAYLVAMNPDVAEAFAKSVTTGLLPCHFHRYRILPLTFSSFSSIELFQLYFL